MRIFCKHEWSVIVDKVTESPFQNAVGCLEAKGYNVDIPHQMCQTERQSITILSCVKCGKVDKTIVKLK